MAKQICSTCGVAAACLAIAVLNGEPDGIWGGYTTPERQALLWDARCLSRDVSDTVRQLERGQRIRVRPLDCLPVLHALSQRGWSTERVGEALRLSPQSVLRARERARAATDCLTALHNADRTAPGTANTGAVKALE